MNTRTHVDPVVDVVDIATHQNPHQGPGIGTVNTRARVAGEGIQVGHKIIHAAGPAVANKTLIGDLDGKARGATHDNEFRAFGQWHGRGFQYGRAAAHHRPVQTHDGVVQLFRFLQDQNLDTGIHVVAGDGIQSIGVRHGVIENKSHGGKNRRARHAVTGGQDQIRVNQGA